MHMTQLEPSKGLARQPFSDWFRNFIEERPHFQLARGSDADGGIHPAHGGINRKGPSNVDIGQRRVD